MTKAPSNLQDLRRRIYRKAKSDKSHRFWGLFVISRRARPSKRLTVLPKGMEAHPASMARSLRTSNKLGGPTFSRRYGKTWKQAGTSPCRTGGWIFRKGMANSERFDSLYTRPRGARGTEAHPRSHFRGGFLSELLRIQTPTVTTPRTGGSQTQCDAAYVNHYRC